MREVYATVPIAVAPALVIQAFTQAKHLEKWWGVERSLIELTRGGVYTLAWQVSTGGIGYVFSGTIAEYLPAHRLSIENAVYLSAQRSILGPMALTVEVNARPDASVLSITQSGYQQGGDWDWYYEAVKAAWPTVVIDIKKYLENFAKQSN